MKVIALFQFYFPYVLPRAPDWPKSPIGFQFPNFRAALRPRATDEALFPNEIDQTLSLMDVKLIRVTAVADVNIKVRDRCFDRIEVRVENLDSHPVSSEMTSQADVQDEFLSAAIRACNLFLEHCRVSARSAFVIGVERHYRLEDERFYIITPHTSTWFNGDTGERLPVYAGTVNARASSGAIPSPERGTASMERVLESLRNGVQPNLASSLLLDAEAALRTNRIREATMVLGTACEVASDDYLRRLGKLDDQAVDAILRRKDLSFAQKRYHEITNLLSGRSLQQENNEAFKLVENAYRARNKVAHEGRPYYEDGGATIKVDQRLATRFVRAAESTIDWLSKI